ncbi:MAG: DUF1579 family protein [Gemmatimonadaceae bacterium]
MKGLDSLKACAGSWRGTSRLHEAPGKHEDSPSTAAITPILTGRFVRLDYSWVYQGAPQEGSLLIGYDKTAGNMTAHWIDSWHMSNKILACEGAADDSDELSVRGSYAAPPGPDWGWRTNIIANPPGGLRMVMYNISPEGQEYLAVEASYTRA